LQSCHRPPQVRIEPDRDHIGQLAGFQVAQKFADEKARVCAQRVEPKARL